MALLTPPSLCMVTYLRKNEFFTSDLVLIADSLHKEFKNNFKIVVFCDEKTDEHATTYLPIKFVQQKGTKYKRLSLLMQEDSSELYFSVDNDINGDLEAIINFLKAMICNEYDLGWGRIRAAGVYGFVPNLVAVDKLLSHNIIRPFLWKIGCGISIPGQIFCIRRESFKYCFFNLDTYLDDLAIGLYAKRNNKKILAEKNILGYEKPSTTFPTLLQQRVRWASGFVSLYRGVSNCNDKILIAIHGIAYHFLWLIYWVLLYTSAQFFSIWSSLVIFFIISLVISIKDIKSLGYVVLYQFLFPIVHIKWWIEVIKLIFNKQGELQ